MNEPDTNSAQSKKIGDINQYQKSELPISEKVVIDAIEKANKAISGANKEFQFSIHSETKQILIKVLDKETKEVVGEFPSEKVLDMIAKITEKSGIMFDERG
jgi:flagellar protein FlaG